MKKLINNISIGKNIYAVAFAFLLIANCLLQIANSSAQAPQAIPYQAVARNTSGNLIANQNISLQFSIQDSPGGFAFVYYQETQSATTNALGLFTATIGQGTPVTGTFDAINWGGGFPDKYLRVELDVTGGTTYTDMGSTLMLSVPYALYSAKSANGLEPGAAAGNTLHWDGTSWINDNALSVYHVGMGPNSSIGINTSSPGATLHIEGNENNAIKFTNFSTGDGSFDGFRVGINANQSYFMNEEESEMTFGTFGVDRMRIASDGNVSIGGFLPVNKLEVVGGDVNVDASSGYKINSTAVAGTYLRGDGARYVAAALSASDITAGTVPVANLPALAGDVNGAVNATTVTAIQATPVSPLAPVNGTILKAIAGVWTPAADDNTTYTNGTGIDVTGTVISNTSPDVPVTMTGAGATTVTGTYPNFTVTSTDNNSGGTVTNVSASSPLSSSGGNTPDITLTGVIPAGNLPSLAGDVTGAVNANTVAKLQNRNVAATAPINGQVLTYNATLSQWEPGTSTIGWGITGNAGTVDGNNFIGTTDNVPLSFKVNNEKAGRIDAFNMNTFFGYQSGKLNVSGHNTGFGDNALSANTLGFYNTAIGEHALYANTEGTFNIATGSYALTANTTGTSNLAVGYGALSANTTGGSNTSIGSSSLNTSVAGDNGVAIGNQSQYYANNTSTSWDNTNTSVGYESLRGSPQPAFNTGVDNTAIGREALKANSTGYENTAAGMNTLAANTSGHSNTASGYDALRVNVSGYRNTALGSESLYSNSTGTYNTAAGHYSLYNNNSGNYNTAMGSYALLGASHGSNGVAIGYGSQQNANNTTSAWDNTNTSIGFQSLKGSATPANNTGNYNTAIGREVLFSNTSGGGNIAVGYISLYNNTIGANNTAMGGDALYSNIAGSNGVAIGYYSQRHVNNTTTAWDNTNTSVGYQSLQGSLTPANNTGFQNTAIGRGALKANSFGYGNTALGYQSLLVNSNGVYNTAMGANSLKFNYDGSYNTALSVGALESNYDGSDNTSIGYASLAFNESGNYNTAIGSLAGHGASGIDYSTSTFVGAYSYLTVARANVTMLGYGIANAQCTASNQVLLGNTAIGSIRAQVTGITAYSDARFKTNVKDDVKGLDFILKLKPVTYNQNPKEIHKIWGTPDSLVSKIDHSDIEKQRFIGFIAQDVEKAAKESGFDFPGIDSPKNDKEVYSLRYTDFTMPLVKAIQEQQKMIEELKKEIAEMKKGK